MSYTIYFTDPAKTNEALTIDDNTIDSRLSVSFVGKNASNYGSAISTNFLHLLENFADATPPTGLSVQGQLWYDTSNPDVPVLRIGNPSAGNGSPTSWAPASGIWAQSTTPGNNPTYGGAKAGDIWVNTAQGQLYINTDGTNNWTLVGPSFSGTLQTGSFPDTVNDNFGAPHKIIKSFIDGNIVEIISNDSFIPQSKIPGFTNILPGVNVSTNNGAALNATSNAAKNLYVTYPNSAYVSANSFVRNDIDNTINAALTVQNGVIVGANSTFNFRINPTVSREAQIINSSPTGKITLNVYNDTTQITLLNANGPTRNVGIAIGTRDPNPSYTLEVGGHILVGGALVVNTSTLSTFNGDVAIVGSITNTGTVTIGSTTTINGPLFINSATISNSAATFASVTATIFQGTLLGTALAANSLTNASAFAIQGDVATSVDVNFKGVPGTYIFTSTVQPSAITGRTSSLNTSSADWTNFYNLPTNGKFSILAVETTGTSSITTNVVQIERKSFLADVIANLIPSGTIVPFAGINVPPNWLLCDGQATYKSKYPSLFEAIGYTYGQPVPTDSNIFSLPDLRGRGVIGYDNMDNNTLGLSPAIRVPGALTPDGSIGSAAAVAGGTSTVFLSTGTVSTGTGTVVNNAQSVNIMNPYLAMNYIIKT